MNIRALLIDDEKRAIAILKNRLELYFPNITIIGETQTPKEGLALIEDLKPDIVFLDVVMPQMNGFELLTQVKEPHFELIFVTAYDEYAINAIKHCAIGYLLKPIDNDDLILAVDNAISSIKNKTGLKKNKQFIENINKNNFNEKKIAISVSDGLEFISIEDILHCEGDDGYTKIHTLNGKQILSSNSVGYFNKLLANQNFYLVHKSHLINLNHIKKYQYDGYLYLINNASIPVSFSRRKDFKNFLKNRASLSLY